MALRLPLAPGGTPLTRNQNIKIGGTALATPTALHQTGATQMDEVWIEATNTDTVSHTLTVLHGIATLAGGVSPDDTMSITIPPKGAGWVMVLQGESFTGSSIVGAFADTANVINVRGWINRIG
jgi:hypothetical protein